MILQSCSAVSQVLGVRSDGTGRAAVVAALTEAAQNPAKPGSPRSVIPHLSKELGSFELVYVYCSFSESVQVCFLATDGKISANYAENCPLLPQFQTIDPKPPNPNP